MSDLTMVMTFELLPNEMLIECFEYLNTVDIFYSFDQLNPRFNKLIRSIPLHLNLQHVRKSIFDRFCTKMLSNPEIKNQIISLKLSNQDTCDQINTFVSLFSLDEFSHLQSLTFDRITRDNEEKIKSMLLLIPNLCSFRSMGYRNQIPTVLLSAKLQTLAVRNLYRYWDNIQNFPIINLTVLEISLQQLHGLFSCTPMLKYLNVHFIYMHSSSVDDNKDYNHYYTTNLQKIVIHDFNGRFQDFKMFVKQTPSLKSLTISSRAETLIDAYGWQDLITTSLPYLKTFNFKFTHLIENNNNIIIDKFKQFQNSFWQDEHHWDTEYVLDRNSAYIYTIPYISNTYILTPYTNRYSNKLINDFNKFNNMTNLILYQKTMKNKCEFYFSNVESLLLENELRSSEYCEDRYLYEKHVLSLKMIINLSNLKHLNISSKCKTDMLSLLLAILKQSSQLSSLTIIPYALPRLFTDDEICGYLNKMIKKLDIYRKYDKTLNEPDIITKLCEVFSNLEQLKFNIQKFDNFLCLLNNLPKLSFLNIFLIYDYSHFIDQFKKEVSNMNVLYVMYEDSHDDVSKVTISIWKG